MLNFSSQCNILNTNTVKMASTSTQVIRSRSVSPDCKSGLLQPLGHCSHPDLRNTIFPKRLRLDYLIFYFSPARGSTQVSLCLFPRALVLWHFLHSAVHIQFQASIYTFAVSWAFMAGAASQAGDADSSRAPGLTSCLRWWVSTVVLYCWCHSDSASVLLYFTFNFL